MDVIDQISQLAQVYKRVLNEGDVAGIKALFLADCILTHVEGDDRISHMTMSQYCELVQGREPPIKVGFPPYGSVVSIDVASSRMAMIRLESAVQPRYFMDYLTLVKIDGQWRIASKTYYIMRVEQ